VRQQIHRDVLDALHVYHGDIAKVLDIVKVSDAEKAKLLRWRGRQAQRDG
jgi:hypothetical protein